jgi:glycosyltransferase involved in cell wall biosynthesis
MKKKILFAIYSIHGGGAEKRTQKILENLDLTKVEPHLCVFHLTGKETLEKKIPLHDLSTKLRPASFFLTLKLIKLIFKLKPQKIFSILWSVNLVALIAGKLTNTPVAINEANTLSASLKKFSFSYLREKLVTFLYPKALIITTVSKYVKMDLIKNFKLSENKIITIHTGINIKTVEELSKKYDVGNKNHILTCGGLHWRKNHNLLLEALEQLKEYSVIILGTGHLKKPLDVKAKNLGINLVLPGFKENPYPYFKNAAVFVLTSFYEGMPNVLLEAMALKIPVISVDCPGGIREIITDGKTGLIVPQNDKQALANAIQTLMTNPELCQKLTQSAYNNLNNNFTLKKMIKEYEVICDM